jgi:dynein heavy chain
MVAILETYYCKDILDDAYVLSESGLYRAPEEGIYESYTEAIKALPINAAPDVFGMHANADITKDQGEAYGMLESIMTTQPRSSGGDGDGPEAVVIRVADDMLQRLPSNYDVEIIQRTYPVLYEESMNTVLCQELTRFNALLTVIRQSLTNVKKAIKGLVVMSASLDFVFNDAFDGKIPGMWKKRSYPSLKPLGSYFNDLLDRLEFFQGWVNGGIPNTFWLSGFFFTQSFLTGALQNYARAKTIPIDTVGFTFEFMRESRQALDEGEKPEFGVYTHGLYLEGARWDSDAMVLGESRPKELHTLVPVIWMRPWIKDQINPPQHYVCPLYKTSDRRGILSTTGHSTNFVMPIETPSNHDANHWIKRGAAMLTQLDD